MDHAHPFSSFFSSEVSFSFLLTYGCGFLNFDLQQHCLAGPGFSIHTAKYVISMIYRLLLLIQTKIMSMLTKATQNMCLGRRKLVASCRSWANDLTHDPIRLNINAVSTEYRVCDASAHVPLSRLHSHIQSVRQGDSQRSCDPTRRSNSVAIIEDRLALGDTPKCSTKSIAVVTA